MLRLPLTNIFLSQADLDHHLSDVDTYQNLLKQGFHKKKIMQHLKQLSQAHCEDGITNNSELDEFVDTVQLSSQHLSALDSGIEHRHLTSSVNKKSEEAVVPMILDEYLSPSVAAEEIYHHRTAPQARMPTSRLHTSHPSSNTVSSSDADTGKTSDFRLRQVSQAHAPRQSSLLRFANTTGSDEESSIEVDHCALPSPVIPPAHPPSNAQSRAISDTEEILGNILEGLDTISISNLKTSKIRKDHDSRRQFSDSSLDIQTNTLPSGLVSTSYAMDERNGLQGVSPPSDIEDREYYQSLHARTTSVHSPPPVQGLASGETSSNTDEEAISSRSEITQEPDEPRCTYVDTPGLQRSPAISLGATWAPRHHDGVRSARNNDSFLVYDDSRPPVSQPQTPADLDHRRMIDERSANYTAPPAMISYGSRIHGHARTGQVNESGDLSPTVRAIDLRNRRNREFRRSAIVESLRFRRSLRSMQHLDTDTTHRDQSPHLDMWRDDLDADRVGEENFDLDLNAFRTREDGNVRTFSGDQP